MKVKPLNPLAKIIDAVVLIEKSSSRTAVVVSDAGRLIGTITDGDVRRHLISGGSLESNVCEIMNQSPIYSFSDQSDDEIRRKLLAKNIEAMPIVDRDYIFLEMVGIKEVIPSRSLRPDTLSALIMAGGEGSRLRPITESIPKPMVEVGGLPLIEHQVRNLVAIGIKSIYISLNYLGHMIEEHFSKLNFSEANIIFIREAMKMGTGGPISMLPSSVKSVLVLNGDIVTRCNFRSMYEYYISNQAEICIGVTSYKVNIPYGVIEVNGVMLKDIVEKPEYTYLCNAGVYILSPKVSSFVPKNTYVDMPEIIDMAQQKKLSICVYPIHEYWSDIGTIDDLYRTRLEINNE